MKTIFSLVRSAMVVALSVAALTSCQLIKSEEEWSLEKKYATYTQRHAERAQELRRAAAEAATMRVRFNPDFMPGEEVVLPLTEQEVQELREIFSELEATPALDIRSWQLSCGTTASFLFYTYFELQDKEGDCIDIIPLMSQEPIGDAAKAEIYRHNAWGPRYMLPSATYRRWQELPLQRRIKAAKDKMLRRAERE